MNSSVDLSMAASASTLSGPIYRSRTIIAMFLALMVFFQGTAIASPIQEGGTAPASSSQESSGEVDQKSDDNAKKSTPGFFDGLIWFILPIVLILFLFMSGRPNQKEKKKREEFIASLKKNDEIVTAGGIVAKVVSVKNNPNTVKLLLDEKSGASMTVTHAAISRIFKDDSEESQDEKKD